MMQVLISQIRYNHNNLSTIENVFTRFKLHSQVENILTWTAFSWVNNKHELTVDMIYGILEEPLDMTHRDYIHFAKKDPGQIYFGTPVYGSTSKIWMIPAGIGVTNDDNNYVGSVVIGFSIKALLEKFKATITNEGIDFAFLDKDLKVIFHSKKDKEGANQEGTIVPSFLSKSLEKLDFTSEKSQILTDVNYKKGGENYYLYKINKYPFLIYLTYDKNLVKEELWQGLAFRIIEITVVGLTILLLLLLLYRQVVKPLVVLSKIGDEISKDNCKTKAPRSWTYEITNLTKQMLRLKQILHREKREKENLITTAAIVTVSDRAKDAFAQEVNATSHEPLQIIRSSVELLMSNFLGSLERRLTHEEQLTLLREAFKASSNIHEKVDDVLNLEFVNVPELLSECIAIHAKIAHTNHIDIYTCVACNVPGIYVDKLKFKQIIVAILKRSLDYSPRNSSIEIKIDLTQDFAKTWLEITIKDNGFGLANNERERIYNKTQQQDRSYDHTRLSQKIIERLVDLHKGKIDFRDVRGKGSLVEICFPYSEKDKKDPKEELPHNVVSLFR